MREVQLYRPAQRRKLPDIVRRLQFAAGGGELFAWVEEKCFLHVGRRSYNETFYSCIIGSGESRHVHHGGRYADDLASPPAVSRDGRYFVAELRVEDDWDHSLFVQDLHSPEQSLPAIPTAPIGFGGLFFTPDGTALIAVRNGHDHDEQATDVARFELAQVFAPPKRIEEHVNPLTLRPYKVSVWNFKWKILINPTGWHRATTAALSADGRFLAVGDETGDFHVADLKAKKVLATLPPEAKAKGERVASRIAFDPKAEWVVRLAGGRLFARPLKDGKPWRTKPALGTATDFAFHPAGRVICAVFADGHARYLDALTGEVTQTFRWSKKPKPLYSVAFAPDGLTCAAGGENGRVILWDVDI